MTIKKFFNVGQPHSLLRKSAAKNKNPPNNIGIDIIIPVYKGYTQTKICIESVLNSNLNRYDVRIIIVNDCTPDLMLEKYLIQISKNKKIILFKNKKNKGFVSTVNFGMDLSNKNDVILLNSDTEVCGDWLDKLVWHAYSRKNVGTVTPFSNNATICSYPNLDGFSKFPNGSNLKEFDSAFFLANKNRNIKIPTAVGFCMFIKRECLNNVGSFDEKKFGKGYGEENDFCLRATKKGWVHLLAGDTFVYHEGAVSFKKTRDARIKKAIKTLTSLYPNYHELIIEHIKKNESSSLIIPAMIERVSKEKKPKVLHILHHLGGGTEKHVKELIEDTSKNAYHFVMIPLTDASGTMKYNIFSTCDFESINIEIEINKSLDVTNFLSKINISFIHIHQTIGYQFFDLKKIIRKLNVPYFITIHDYMFICPRINLVHPKTNFYCNEPNSKVCNMCINIDRPFDATDITSWRRSYRSFIYAAEKIICPSIDVANRIKKYFPKSNIKISYHEKLTPPKTFILNSIDDKERIRIAILGIIAPHKGGELISNLLDIVERDEYKFEFKLIGFVQDHPTTKNLNKNRHFSYTGMYKDNDLISEINKYNPHLIFFPARWPETYSYTLSAALNSGYPIIAPDIGAFPERLNSNLWAWLYRANIQPNELLNLISEIMSKHISIKKPQKLKKNGMLKGTIEKNFYQKNYFIK